MKPCGWLVRAPNVNPQWFSDYGRALACSIAVGGVIVELFEKAEQ